MKREGSIGVMQTYDLLVKRVVSLRLEVQAESEEIAYEKAQEIADASYDNEWEFGDIDMEIQEVK